MHSEKNPLALPSLVLVSLSAYGLSACGPAEIRPRTTAPYAEEESGLIGGDYTYERPEVGSISIEGGACTATLVGPQLVITAAHCVDYRSRDTPGYYGDFEIRTGPTSSQSFRITRIASYMRNPAEVIGPDDVALLELGAPVPASLATPAPIARREPSAGSGATIYGYGCQARGSGGRFAKQKMTIRWGEETANLCPGDSGGPTIGEDGAVSRTNSGYYGGPTGPDDFGQVFRHAAAVEATAARWGRALSASGAPGAPPPEDPPSMDPPSMEPPAGEPPPEEPPAGEPRPEDPPADDGCGGGGCAPPDDGGECGSLDGSICLPGNIIQLCTEDGHLEIYFCPDGSGCSPGASDFACEWIFGF
jgi:hypothetical protein